ncbi:MULTISPECIES: substrate-binding periplasmic protein [unclassified Janthinobacterium]|uniref:substrate-binding periplasmic protein n=1 Tax=unclassified Janthinobacterium TaxID=2610881 RepID=UPI00036D99E6|nr:MULTISPECIES: ABC transporter substrate-binding protein [unclassified Janthinobacterium]MEC5163123.1 polar amino acid transport system substrate-binding protein [Janthinobacterium sp. CG_S6]
MTNTIASGVNGKNTTVTQAKLCKPRDWPARVATLAGAAALALGLCAGPAQGAQVSMAFGEKIPPFCLPESNSGIELEVIGEALAHRGHVLRPKYYPFARIPLAFKNRDVAAAMTDLGQDMTAEGAFYGDPAVIYDNVFISLKERHLQIRKPADLQGLRVLSFAGAAKRYPEWLGPVAKAGRYFEQNDQALQVLTLNYGRYDVVLSDRNIFKYFSIKLAREHGLVSAPTTQQSFVKVNPMDYRPVFRDRGIRDDFNAGLKHLKDSGRFEAIYRKYLGDGAAE